MLKIERAHSHTVFKRSGWVVLPAALYVHAHEDGDKEHEHGRLARLEAVLAKVEADGR